MNPSKEAITAIRQRVTDWTPADDAIAAALNAETIPNPQPQGTVPPTFNFEQVAACLSGAEILHIKEFMTTQRLLDDVDAQHNLNVARWAAISIMSGDISPASGQKVMALVTTPVPDPAWTATIPAPLGYIGRLVDSDDVASARAAQSEGDA